MKPNETKMAPAHNQVVPGSSPGGPTSWNRSSYDIFA